MSSRFKRALCLIAVLTVCAGFSPGALAASEYDRPGQKLAALTFDDGPSDYTYEILDALRDHGAKATFFFNGNKAEGYGDQIRRVVDEGHQLANHTWSHPYLAELSDWEIRSQVDRSAAVLSELSGISGTGNNGFYLRPPYGSFNKRVAEASGVPVIWCTVDSEDWKYRDADRLVSYVSSVLKDGDIVVMHSTHHSTARGIGRLVDALHARGFELVTVEELLWRRGVTPEPGKIYYSVRNTGVELCPRELWYDESRLSEHWAYEDIMRMHELGVVTGNEYGEFLPEFPMTRGMFATALGRLAGVDASVTKDIGYPDVPAEHYANPYVAWAVANGIMYPYFDNEFGIDIPICRQDAAVAVAEYLKRMGVQAEPFDLSVYSDQDTIAAWGREDVATCSALGIINGSDGLFLPDDSLTRAMCAVLLSRVSRIELPEKVPAQTQTPEQTEPTEPAPGSQILPVRVIQEQ